MSQFATSSLGRFPDTTCPAAASRPTRPSASALVSAQRPRALASLPPYKPVSTPAQARNVITRFRDDSAADVIYATAPTAPAAVPVLFQLNRRCAFGDAWGVCGSSPSLGSWDLTKAVPLKWTPGDLWCGLTFLPDTSPVEFKFVLLDARNGYKPKGWANDVSGPANLRMDVRRSGCLLTRGQAQAYAATPELSTAGPTCEGVSQLQPGCQPLHQRHPRHTCWPAEHRTRRRRCGCHLHPAWPGPHRAGRGPGVRQPTRGRPHPTQPYH
ncbi:hypothetical protein V8C86DRAFT_1270879 [Haematococcus lacustris]